MTDQLGILRHYAAIWKESMHVTIDKQIRDALDWAIAELERLRGITPELPPRPPRGEGLPRYGIRWNGPTEPLAVPMDDGYWTPWHLAVQPRPAVPDGFRLVPVEPTPDMLCAGYWSGSGDVSVNEEWVRREVYSRMLNAAPQPPGGGGS